MKLRWAMVFCWACGGSGDAGDWENSEIYLQGQEATKSAAQFTRTSTQIIDPILAERKDSLLTTDFAAYILLGSSRSYSGEVGCPDCQEPSEPSGDAEPSEPAGGPGPSEPSGGPGPSEPPGRPGP